MSSSPNPSEVTDTVTFSATVTATSPGVGTPTGTVQFYVDGAPSGAPANLNGGAVTTLTGVTFTVPGSHPVTAAYLGNIDFVTSTSTTLTQVVKGFPTTTTVTSSLNAPVFDQPVTFTATVGSGQHGTPTGTVQFSVDGSNVGGLVSLTAGAAISAPVTNLAAGISHSVTATYLGVTNWAGSISPAFSQAVNKAGTTTVVISSTNPSDLGQPVSFTATVSSTPPGGGIPTGTVAFFLDGQPLSTVALSFGSASTAPLSNLDVRVHTLQAVYSGSLNHLTSAAFVTPAQAVVRIDAANSVVPSASPSVFGQPVTFTATLTGTQGTPTGTVQFGVDGANLGSSVTLTAGGVATSTATGPLSVGDHTVTATYSGNVNYKPDTGTVTQTVGQANSTTTNVISSVTSSVSGQPVTFTATVLAAGLGAGNPSGTVDFSADGGASFGTATVTGGNATSPSISTLGVGPHTVTATYSGDGSFAEQRVHPQTVIQDGTTVTVTSAPTPAVFGQLVTFSATVTASVPGSGTPSGTVRFSSGGFSHDANLQGGFAVAAYTGLPIGDQVITASYLGDTNFLSGAFNTTTQHVNPCGHHHDGDLVAHAFGLRRGCQLHGDRHRREPRSGDTRRDRPVHG